MYKQLSKSEKPLNNIDFSKYKKDENKLFTLLVENIIHNLKNRLLSLNSIKSDILFENRIDVNLKSKLEKICVKRLIKFLTDMDGGVNISSKDFLDVLTEINSQLNVLIEIKKNISNYKLSSNDSIFIQKVINLLIENFENDIKTLNQIYSLKKAKFNYKKINIFDALEKAVTKSLELNFISNNKVLEGFYSKNYFINKNGLYVFGDESVLIDILEEQLTNNLRYGTKISGDVYTLNSYLIIEFRNSADLKPENKFSTKFGLKTSKTILNEMFDGDLILNQYPNENILNIILPIFKY